MTDEKSVVHQPSRFEIADAVPVTSEGVQIQTLAQMKVWAAEVAASKMAPKGMDTEAKVVLAAQTGMELGFSLMRSLQAVVIVNGRATLMGEAALGLIRASGMLEVGTDIEVGCRRATEEEKLAKEGNLVGYCRTTRRGSTIRESLFTQADAQLAGLWTNDGPWKKYPKRMLMWRAVAFHMRDYWSDLGNGLMLAEEARDIPRGAAHARDVSPSEGTRTGRTDPLLEPLTDDPAESGPPEGDVMDADFTESEPDTPTEGEAEPGVEEVMVDGVWREVDPETGEVIPTEAEMAEGQS